jgi:hypothetical protein
MLTSIPVIAAGGVNNYFYEQEYKRVIMCHKKISRLMYGTNGLINFMYSLFAFFDPREM